MLSACGGTPQQTARQAVAGTATLYATARIGFEAYANLPRCKANPPPCSDPAKVAAIGGDLLVARDAIDLARVVANSMPADATVAQLSPQGQQVLDQAARAASAAQTTVSGLK
jgi:hypothetical protein